MEHTGELHPRVRRGNFQRDDLRSLTEPILAFTVPAIQRYHHLKKLKLNVGKNDLRIAAVTLEAGATVVTRNLRDFGRVPNLQLEDWSL